MPKSFPFNSSEELFQQLRLQTRKFNLPQSMRSQQKVVKIAENYTHLKMNSINGESPFPTDKKQPNKDNPQW